MDYSSFVGDGQLIRNPKRVQRSTREGHGDKTMVGCRYMCSN